MIINKQVKRLLSAAGIDVRLKRNIAKAEELRKLEEWRRAWHALASQAKVRTIVDVGANEGQFARMIAGVFPGCPVLCFEPLRQCRPALERELNAIPGSQLFEMALGDITGMTKFRQTSFSPCSSILVPNERLRKEVNTLEETAVIDVPIARLDDIIDSVDPKTPLLVKLDVQGYETEVLAGATRTLSVTSVVVLEVAFVPLYENQPLFDDVYEILRKHDFYYRGNLTQNVSNLDGVITEADALFVKSC